MDAKLCNKIVTNKFLTKKFVTNDVVSFGVPRFCGVSGRQCVLRVISIFADWSSTSDITRKADGWGAIGLFARYTVSINSGYGSGLDDFLELVGVAAYLFVAHLVVLEVAGEVAVVGRHVDKSVAR